MRVEEFAGKTIADATRDGLSKMGLTEDRAVIEVLDQGGFLRKAKVRITDKGSEGDRAVAFIEGLVEVMNLPCTIELKEDEKNANIEIISVNSGALIGHRGDVLDAIQYLASIVANEGKQDFKRIVVDCENYRERRVGTLESLAKKMANKAVENARPIKLEPMNAFERRVIHSFLTEDDRVKTSSFGEEPYRYLTIKPNNMKPRSPRPFDKNRQGGNRDRKFDRDNRGGGRDRNFKRPQSDRPRKTSAADSIKNGFSSFGYIGNSGNKTEE